MAAHQYTCNLCSLENTALSLRAIDPEAASCRHCGSNVRFRWIVHALSTVLFGRSLHLKDFPERKAIKGIGLSDEPVYATTLAEKLDYTNTYYHREPRFDIKDLSYGQPNSLDFIIASEVVEHVTPPVQPAFNNLNRLLKPGGVLFFTTPWRPIGFTVEHFPQLFDWTLIQYRDQHLLINETEGGDMQAFGKLCFHGGPGETLEMRVFSQSGLLKNLETAGLQPQFKPEPVPELGIVYRNPWSLPCLVRKVAEPQTPRQMIGESEEQRLRREVADLYRHIDDQCGMAVFLQEELAEAREQLRPLLQERELARESKWLKLGNRLGLGPNL